MYSQSHHRVGVITHPRFRDFFRGGVVFQSHTLGAFEATKLFVPQAFESLRATVKMHDQLAA